MVAYSFKRQFVNPIKAGLGMPIGDPFVPPPKRQTIRARGRRAHAKPGDELQLYTGMRTKNCILIGRARCVESCSILLWFTEGSVAAHINGKVLGPRQMKDFAQADGFKDALDMAAFWSHENGTREGDKWEGVLIRWAPIKASP